MRRYNVEPERLAVAFSRVLRGAGVDVPVGATLTFARGLAEVGLAHRDGVYWAGRATLVTRPEQIATYDRVFARFWSEVASDDADDDTIAEIVIALDIPGSDDDTSSSDLEQPDVPVLTVRWSPTEVLRRRDFATYTAAEFAEARKLMADLRFAGARRASRRRRPTSRSRGAPDIRRTVRRSLRAGGEPVSRAFLEAGERARRVVLLLDVSGSMESY